MVQDFQHAWRALRRTPAFTSVAVLTLALGIGGTTAIFSVVDAILIRPLPYPAADRLVALTRVTPRGGDNWSPADYLDVQDAAGSLAAVAALRQDVVDVTGRGEPVRLTGALTTGAFFDVFQMPALEGRAYSATVDGPGGPRVAVLAEGAWRRVFGASGDALGSTVRLNGVPTTIVGVMPAAFTYPPDVEVWIRADGRVPASPVETDGDLETQRDLSYLTAVGRLAPDVALDAARAELATIAERQAEAYPSTNAGESVTALPLRDHLVGGVRTALVVLLAAIAAVLLIACANVASLLLARGAARRRELSVRTALGAGRGQRARYLLAESLVLAGLGGAAGVLVATWGISALTTLAPESTPRLAEVALDPRALAFTIAASVAVGLLFGVAPAVTATRLHILDALKEGGRTATGPSRLRSVLVAGEVALALMLLVGAGLLLFSFERLRGVETGLAIEELVVVDVPLPQTRYDAAGQARFYEDLLERLRANPATTTAAVVFPTPFGGAQASGGYAIEGRAAVSRAEQPLTELNAVSPGYLAATGVPLLRGRDLSDRDRRDTPPVLLINRTLAEREWPGEDPLGRRIALGGPPEDEDSWFTVVGVVADHRRGNLAEAQAPAVYLTYQQFTLPFMGVVLRAPGGAASVAPAVRAAVAEVDPLLPVGETATITQRIAAATGQPRFRAFLVGAFALTALLLAAVGLYGLVSYTVAQRVPELGLRLALGAQPLDVARLVVGQGLWLAGTGVVVGLAGAAVGARWMESLLYDVRPTEPALYAGLALLLVLVTLLACLGPARRAMRVDPMVALRAE